MGQLSAGLAQTNRASAVGRGRRSCSDQTSEQRGECAQIILKECERLNRLRPQFLDFARPRTPHYQAVDVQDVLTAVVELAAHAV